MTLRMLSQGAKELAIAIAIGLAGLFIVSLIKGYTFLGDQERGLQDRSYVNAADTRASAVAPPFLLLNLTQKDQHRLDYPAVVPRDLLARLLTLAAAGEPQLIVVAADLGWSGDAAGETELKTALAAIAARKKPAVLLVRAPFGRTDGPPVDTSPALKPDVLRPTPYDALVSAATNLFWVSALGPIDSDGTTRRYRIAARVCRGGESLTLPGIQLAACVALSDPGRLAALHAAGEPGAKCKADGTPMPIPPPGTFSCAGREWPVGREGAEADIAYRMSWEISSGVPRPQQLVTGSNIPVEEVGLMDALDLVEHAADTDAAARFAGRVVIIGSSADIGGDHHRTALGPMPGFMVIANAIRSALEHGPIVRGNIWLNLLATILISAITYLSWAAIQRLRGLRAFILRQSAAPALSLVWMFLFTAVMPTDHVVEFLFPQFAVMLYLVILEAKAELRLRPSGEAATASATGGETP